MTEAIHLNPAGHFPPVNCPLLIELEPGNLVKAHRESFARTREDVLVFHLADGSVIEGLFRWTYP